MNRTRHRLLSLIALAALSLAGADAADATNPTTLLQCLTERDTCNSKLQSCGAEVSQTQTDLATCYNAVGQISDDLAGCNGGRSQLNDDLAACRADVGQTQADLFTCSTSLAACQALAFPSSGQTTAFPADRNDGITGTVAVPDDGALQVGASLDYTDNGDGTVTDIRTGLMWEKKSDDGGLHDKDNIYYWSGNGDQETIWDWLEDVNAEGIAGFAGHNDWRVPNAKELQSIVNYQNTPAAVSAAFNHHCVPGATLPTGSCTFMGNYWSSTTWAESAGSAWQVNFNFGEVSPSVKPNTARVLAVRAGSL